MGERGLSWEGKIDHHLRALLALNRPEEAQRAINVLVRFTGRVESLRAHGLTVRAVAGDIATASLALEDVPKAVSAPEILFMELSQPLGLDSSHNQGQPDS